jgi:hypothetical protein
VNLYIADTTIHSAASDAKFDYVFGIEVTADGIIYSSDPWNDATRKITKD